MVGRGKLRRMGCVMIFKSSYCRSCFEIKLSESNRTEPSRGFIRGYSRFGSVRKSVDIRKEPQFIKYHSKLN